MLIRENFYSLKANELSVTAERKLKQKYQQPQKYMIIDFFDHVAI